MELTSCDLNEERSKLSVQDKPHLCNKEMNYLWHEYSRTTEPTSKPILLFCNNEELEYCVMDSKFTFKKLLESQNSNKFKE